MLDLTPVKLEDCGWIRTAVTESGVRISEYSFGILYGWQESFGPRVVRFGDMLLSTIDIGGGWYAWPVGRGDVTAALDAMRLDAEERGRPFRLCHVPKEKLDEIYGYFGGRVRFDHDPGFSDYIYSAEKLAALSGQKYHSKKNHLNRFTAENDWRFEPITPANISDCREMASRWFEQNTEEHHQHYDEEIFAINKTLDHYFDMAQDGGLIRTQDGVVAFTVGELLCRDTFNSHFEKAFSHINGAYAAINQQFAEYVLEKYPDVRYINREEDMGIAPLRKAKQSYHPEFLADKYTAVTV